MREEKMQLNAEPSTHTHTYRYFFHNRCARHNLKEITPLLRLSDSLKIEVDKRYIWQHSCTLIKKPFARRFPFSRCCTRSILYLFTCVRTHFYYSLKDSWIPDGNWCWFVFVLFGFFFALLLSKSLIILLWQTRQNISFIYLNRIFHASHQID